MRNSPRGTHHRLFVYGTLQDDTVVEGLTGQRFAKQPAVLTGYRKILPPGGYPYIVADPGGTVGGFLLQGIDDDALRIFDRYEDEGRLYRRTIVAVTVGGRPQNGMTYVGIPAALAQALT